MRCLMVLAVVAVASAQVLPIPGPGRVVTSTASPAYVNSAAATAGATPITISYSVASSSDILIVCEKLNGTGLPVVISSTKIAAGSWTLIGAADDGSNGAIGCKWAVPPSTGTDTITCDNSAGNVAYCGVVEISGASQTSPIHDFKIGYNATSGTSMSTAAITASTTDLIYAAAFGVDGTTTKASGWAGPYTFSTNGRYIGESLVPAGATSVTATATQTNTNPWIIMGMSIH